MMLIQNPATAATDAHAAIRYNLLAIMPSTEFLRLASSEVTWTSCSLRLNKLTRESELCRFIYHADVIPMDLKVTTEIYTAYTQQHRRSILIHLHTTSVCRDAPCSNLGSNELTSSDCSLYGPLPCNLVKATHRRKAWCPCWSDPGLR